MTKAINAFGFEVDVHYEPCYHIDELELYMQVHGLSIEMTWDYNTVHIKCAKCKIALDLGENANDGETVWP